MSDTLQVPGMGQMPKKYVVALGVTAMVVIGYMLFRKHADNAAAAQSGTYPAAAAADQTTSQDTTSSGDTSGGGGNPYADWTNYYGSAGDQSVSSGKIIGYDYLGRPIYGTSSSSGSSSTMTESQWIAAAAADLEQSTGVTYTTAAAALTKWIAGQQLTAAEVLIVKEGIAIEGNPPNGLLPIHQLPSGDDGGGGSGGGGSGGGGSGGGHGPSAPPAPTFAAIDAHGATVNWGAAHPGDHPIDHYVIWTRAAHQGPQKAGTAHGTSFRIGRFKPNTWHAVWVNAVDTAGRTSSPSPAATFTTHRR